MATHTATRLMRSFPQRFGLNTSWTSAITNTTRHFYTGDRYQGYVSFFQPDELFGFLVREDVPDKEYYFHSTDLHTRNIPRVRPLQQVEFSIVEGRGGNYIGREITGPNSSDLEFNHPNMRLPQTERTRLLSDLPNGLHERHKGVVVTIHADGSGGYIIPDRLNFQVVQFRCNELQTTGIEKIDRFSEVEFFVRASPIQGQRDRAVCITRPGGGLITGERKEIGSRRRQLGAMYGPTDTKARLPADFQQGRERGIIVDFFPDKLFGFVASVDNPNENAVFIHCDDCHISGKRILRKNQLVEFKRVTDEESNRTKALHVSGPNGTVLHNISPNHYLPRDLTTKELEIDENRRRIGSVVHVDRNNRNWIIIKPSEQGYKTIFAFASEIQSVGNRGNIEIGDTVEFTVARNENEENTDNTDTIENDRGTSNRAVNITAEGGYPLVLQGGKYGRYLQSKMNLPIRQSELQPAPLSENQTLTGYISSYSRRNNRGTVEIEAPNGVRYQKAKFTIDDAILADNMDASLAMINSGLVVKFNVVDAGELSEEEKEMKERGATMFERRATNITSLDLDYLQCREYRQFDNNNQNQMMDNTQQYQQQQQQDNRQAYQQEQQEQRQQGGQRRRQGKTVAL